MQGKGLIVAINEDKEFPEAFFKKALKDYSNAFGGVVYDPSEGKPKLLVSLLDSGISMEQLQEVCKDFKTNKKVLFLGEFPKGYGGDMVQPFTVIEGEGEMPQLVAFLEGNYGNFKDDTKADKSSEYLAFSDMLMPTLVDLYDSAAVGKNIDKLTNTLTNDARLRKSLELMCTDRGHITLVAVNGTIINIAKNPLLREYPWGWASNHLGYEEAVANVPAAVKRKLFGKPVDDKPVEAAPDIKVPEAKPTVTPPATETAVPDSAGKSEVTAILHEREQNIKLSAKILTVPKALVGKPRKNWCHTHLGYLPRNWKDDKIELTAYVAAKKAGDAPIKSFQDPKLANALGSDKKLVNVADEPAKITAVDTSKMTAVQRRRLALSAQKEQPQPAAEPEKKVEQPAAPLPIIPQEEIKGLLEWQKKFTGYDGKEIHIDPELMPELEAECPSYAEQIGRQGLEMLYYWKLPEIDDHIKKFPKASGVLMKNLINLTAELITKVQDLETKPANQPAALRRKAS